MEVRNQSQPDEYRSGTMARNVAEVLLRTGAVTIDSGRPFVFTSGVSSPIYTDNRVLMSLPNEREEIISFLRAISDACIGLERINVVAGIATAAIPFAAWLASDLRKPLVYVRLEAKAHGLQKQVEGLLPTGSNVLVVEDLISTGRSIVAASDAIRLARGNVVGCVAIFTYGARVAKEAFRESNLQVWTLCDIHTLLDYAVATKSIRTADRLTVEEWLAEVGWA